MCYALTIPLLLCEHSLRIGCLWVITTERPSVVNMAVSVDFFKGGCYLDYCWITSLILLFSVNNQIFLAVFAIWFGGRELWLQWYVVSSFYPGTFVVWRILQDHYHHHVIFSTACHIVFSNRLRGVTSRHWWSLILVTQSGEYKIITVYPNKTEWGVIACVGCILSDRKVFNLRIFLVSGYF